MQHAQPVCLESPREAMCRGHLEAIRALLGNVDHSVGGGSNTARMYGQMLNDIRGLADSGLSCAELEQSK